MHKLCTYSALKHRPCFPRGHPASEGSRVYVEGLLNADIIAGINLKITALNYSALKHRPCFPRGHPASEGSRVYVEGLLNADIIVGINFKITALLT